jgi:hypothetical protein
MHEDSVIVRNPLLVRTAEVDPELMVRTAEVDPRIVAEADEKPDSEESA